MVPFTVCVYRKSTHTGQYQHITSSSSSSRKVAWIRALVNRAYKVCSNETLLKDELKRILDFMSWNGFPYKLSTKLIEQFKPRSDHNEINHDDLDNSTNNIPKIWIHLPYLGKYDTRLTHSFINRITQAQLSHPPLVLCRIMFCFSSFRGIKFCRFFGRLTICLGICKFYKLFWPVKGKNLEIYQRKQSALLYINVCFMAMITCFFSSPT